MTRRAKALDAIEPEAFVEIHPDDAKRLGAGDGDRVRVASRRGEVRVKARVADRVAPGDVFMAFHFREAAANLLTNDALDPIGKIPEFKYCAVKVEKAAPPPSRSAR
jgi:predicted molibdopterin-dependent oxidoreductase YjgC